MAPSRQAQGYRLVCASKSATSPTSRTSFSIWASSSARSPCSAIARPSAQRRYACLPASQASDPPSVGGTGTSAGSSDASRECRPDRDSAMDRVCSLSGCTDVSFAGPNCMKAEYSRPASTIRSLTKPTSFRRISAMRSFLSRTASARMSLCRAYFACSILARRSSSRLCRTASPPLSTTCCARVKSIPLCHGWRQLHQPRNIALKYVRRSPLRFAMKCCDRNARPVVFVQNHSP